MHTRCTTKLSPLTIACSARLPPSIFLSYFGHCRSFTVALSSLHWSSEWYLESLTFSCFVISQVRFFSCLLNVVRKHGRFLGRLLAHGGESQYSRKRASVTRKAKRQIVSSFAYNVALRNHFIYRDSFRTQSGRGSSRMYFFVIALLGWENLALLQKSLIDINTLIPRI